MPKQQYDEASYNQSVNSDPFNDGQDDLDETYAPTSDYDSGDDSDDGCGDSGIGKTGSSVPSTSAQAQKQYDEASNNTESKSNESCVASTSAEASNNAVKSNHQKDSEAVKWENQPHKVFSDQETYEEWVKKNNWGTKTTIQRKKCDIRYMRCTKVHYKGPECEARLVVRMPNDDAKWLIFTNGKKHTCGEIQNKIQPEIRKKSPDTS